MAQLPSHPTSYPTIKIPRRDLADALLQVGLRLRLSKLRFQCNGDPLRSDGGKYQNYGSISRGTRPLLAAVGPSQLGGHETRSYQGKWLWCVVRGYFNFHAVPTNASALHAFRHHVTDLWRRTLRRRSQKDRLTWIRMTQLVDDWLPNRPSSILGRASASPSHTRGGRSYGAGGGGCGTFIVHTNRWRLPRGPSQ